MRYPTVTIGTLLRAAPYMGISVRRDDFPPNTTEVMLVPVDRAADLEYRHSDKLRDKLGHLLEEYTERAIEWSQSASSPDIVPLGVDRIIALLDRRDDGE